MKKVLFICVGNSCRSQMAEGFARIHGKGVLDPSSAGTMPAASISGKAVQVMREKGIDISAQKPKNLDILKIHDYDIVISMGCGETCTTLEREDLVDWALEDPIGQPVETYRRVRDQIEALVLELIKRSGN